MRAPAVELWIAIARAREFEPGLLLDRELYAESTKKKKKNSISFNQSSLYARESNPAPRNTAEQLQHRRRTRL